jgi:alanine racemase
MELNCMQKRAWAEIDLDALEYNFKLLRRATPASAKICCTVKADAYGHGSVRVAKLYEQLGADYLAVSNIKEALILRDGGIDLPILILGYTDPTGAELLAKNNITQCVYSYDYGKALAKCASDCGVSIRIHVKLDVGMGRIGFVMDDDRAYSQLKEICNMSCFECEGIFTHFPMASEGKKDIGQTKDQYGLFCSIIERLEGEGLHFDIKHCSNTAAGILYPEYSMDMVRYGIALYGALPSTDMVDIGLKNTLSLKTVVSNVKKVKKGQGISYGSDYIAQKDITVATLPIGYDDGFRRENYTSRTPITVNGVLCEITGRVCMDQTMIDVSEAGEISIGDEAVIYGSGSSVSLEEFSENNGKIPYEAMCEISARVPRVYVKNGSVESIRESFV